MVGNPVFLFYLFEDAVFLLLYYLTASSKLLFILSSHSLVNILAMFGFYWGRATKGKAKNVKNYAYSDTSCPLI